MNTAPKKLGRYYIIREIGRGAMGVVYKAHDPVIDREVALKGIQLSFQVTDEERSTYLNRFYREAKAAGKLSHPGIVTIYDAGEDKETGIPFIVMEFLEGTTLQEVTSSGVLLPLEDVNGIIVQVADALNYAHNQDVVHRDIKSANIMIVDELKAKIMDFGVARLPSSDLTRSGQFVGTPNYMSPEQIEGNMPVDGRGDLFSLGVIFYMLLTGERPFSGESFNTVAYKIVHVDPIPPRVLNPGVPEVYNYILSKLLAKDPAQRYQNGAEVIAQLKSVDVTKGESVTVDRPVGEATVVSSTSGGSKTGELEEKGDHSQTIPPAVPAAGAHPQASLQFLLMLGLIVLAAGLAIGSIYYFRTADQPTRAAAKTPEPAKPVPDAAVSLSKQNVIRSKWDLAVSYYQSGLYDKSIDEFEAILKIDPSYEEAQKYLELVQRKKELEEKKKALAAQMASKTSSQPKTSTVKTQTVEPKTATSPLQPAVKSATVDFELEHNLPSGSFYMYLDGKRIYEAPLMTTEKKALLFPKGKLSGSVQLPFGQTTIGLHVICKELGISTYRKVTTNMKEGGAHHLKIRYFQTMKQLEVKWT